MTPFNKDPTQKVRSNQQNLIDLISLASFSSCPFFFGFCSVDLHQSNMAFSCHNRIEGVIAAMAASLAIVEDSIVATSLHIDLLLENHDADSGVFLDILHVNRDHQCFHIDNI